MRTRTWVSPILVCVRQVLIQCPLTDIPMNYSTFSSKIVIYWETYWENYGNHTHSHCSRRVNYHFINNRKKYDIFRDSVLHFSKNFMKKVWHEIHINLFLDFYLSYNFHTLFEYFSLFVFTIFSHNHNLSRDWVEGLSSHALTKLNHWHNEENDCSVNDSIH